MGKINVKRINFLDGRKTRLGGMACCIAGILKAASIFYPLLDKVADGMFYIGLGAIGMGIWSRFVHVFYNTPGSIVNLRSPKITPKHTRSG